MTNNGGGDVLHYDYFQDGDVSKVSGAELDGQIMVQRQFDEYGRVTNNIDRNRVATAQSYDFLDRMATRQVFGANYFGVGANGIRCQEIFVYTALGLTNYSDTLGHLTTFVRDTAGRVLYQTNANTEVQQFTYNPADELLTLTDGKNQTTTWAYDSFGRVTNKLDALGTNLFSYQYDPLRPFDQPLERGQRQHHLHILIPSAT